MVLNMPFKLSEIKSDYNRTIELEKYLSDNRRTKNTTESQKQELQKIELKYRLFYDFFDDYNYDISDILEFIILIFQNVTQQRWVVI